MRFAHTASDRGEVVPCMVTPELVRHEWQWDAHDSLTGSGSYVYRPVYEVRLEWEYPAGVVREMVFVDTYQSDHLFDRLFPQEEPVQYYTKYALPGVRDTSRDLYLFGCGMTSDEAQEKKPAPGVFTLERPMHPATVEISGLVDPLNPEVTVPFVMESGSRIRTVLRSVTKLCGMSMKRGSSTGAQAVLRPVFGVPFCMCGVLAAMPVFALALLKLSLPLLADGWIPARLQGFNSAHTVSRYLPTLGLWDLATLIFAAKCGLGAVLCFCCFCVLPWWQCYARILLGSVPEVSSGTDSDSLQNGETERLLAGY